MKELSAIYQELLIEIRKKYQNFDFATVVSSSPEKSQIDLDGEIEALGQHKNFSLSEDEKNRLKEELIGVGPLRKLIQSREVTEIMINAHNSVWYEESGVIKKSKDCFFSEQNYKNFLNRLYTESKSEPNLDIPFCDGMWRGFRLHASLPPIVEQETHLCLRRHPDIPWSLDRLADVGWARPEGIETLKKMIKNKESFLVVGPTSSGKTSVLSAALGECLENERLVIIEDSREIKPPNQLSISLLTRTNSMSSLKPFDQGQLLKQSLRMRPDRIVVGEVRGGEAKDLLMALATGHNGGMGTLHAQDAKQALIRLEMLVQMGAPQWSLTAIRQLILMSLSHIVVVRNTEGKRRLESIDRITSLESTGFCTEPIYQNSTAN